MLSAGLPATRGWQPVLPRTREMASDSVRSNASRILPPHWSLLTGHWFQSLGAGVGRGLAVGSGLGVGVILGVEVAVGVDVGVALGVTVGVAVGVAVGVTVDVGVGLAVGVGVGVGPCPPGNTRT